MQISTPHAIMIEEPTSADVFAARAVHMLYICWKPLHVGSQSPGKDIIADNVHLYVRPGVGSRGLRDWDWFWTEARVANNVTRCSVN